jgi:hypothetical protein
MGVLDTNKPFYRMEIIEPGSSQPKFVISPNIFLDTELPSDTDQATPDIYLASLNINSISNGDINICELKLQHSAGYAPAIKLESKVKVYLGYYYLDATQGPEYSLVYTGYISRVVVRLQETVAECRSDLYKLTSKRKKITYGTMLSLDEIINKMAIEQGGLELAGSGIDQTEINKQPGFAISDNKSLLDYINTFAQRASLYVFMDVFDEFHAASWLPSDLQARTSDEDREWLAVRDKTETSQGGFYKHELEFGKDIIACDFEISEARYSKIKIIGFKSFGDDPVHTIEPPDVEFTPTDGADDELPVKTFKISHITREDAEKVAENLYFALNRNLISKVVTLGSPQIRLGDGVKITGSLYDVAPYQSLDFSSSSGGNEGLDAKVFQVIKVNHRFNNEEGFVTRLELIDAHSTPTPTEGEEAEVVEEEAEEEARIEMEVVEEEIEGEEEDTPITIIVKTMSKDNEPIPNAEYILITPDGEEIEGTTGDDGIFTHEDMPRGSYELRFKPIEEPGEEGAEEE